MIEFPVRVRALIVGAIVVMLLAVPGAGQDDAEPAEVGDGPRVTEKADRILRSMGEFLRSSKAFYFYAHLTTIYMVVEDPRGA